MVSNHREVGITQDAFDLVRPEHPTEGLLDAFLNLPDFAADRREFAARGVEDLASNINARLDRVGQAGESAHPVLQTAEPGELVADPVEPVVKVVDGFEGFDRLGEFLGLKCRTNQSTSDKWADVVEATEGGRNPGGQGVGHLGREGLSGANLADVGAGLHPSRRVLAERARGLRGHKGADLVEFEQFQRMRVHNPSNPRTRRGQPPTRR